MNIYPPCLSLLILISCLPLAVLAKCDDHFPENTPIRDFVLKDDGTATDHKTGLIWSRCSLGQIWQIGTCVGTVQKENYFGAFEAVKRANSEQYLGFNTWHLPTVDELRSIVEFHCANPAINAVVFPNTPSSWFWSASPYDEFPWYGQPVDFGNGTDDIFYKITYEAFPFPVRLVRNPKEYDPQALGLDTDDDGVNDALEATQGSNPKLKDNDIRRDERFAAQLYRDLFLREITMGEMTQQAQRLKTDPNRVDLVVDLATTPEFQQQRLDVAIMLALVINNQISGREWLNAWRDSLHKGKSVDVLVDGFMQKSELKDTYLGVSKTEYVSALGARLLGRSLTSQEQASGNSSLQSMSRSAFTVHWLTTVAYRHTPPSQVLVLHVANLLANYPLDSVALSDYAQQLDSGKITIVELIKQVLDSGWYEKRFMR